MAISVNEQFMIKKIMFTTILPTLQYIIVEANLSSYCLAISNSFQPLYLFDVSN